MKNLKQIRIKGDSRSLRSKFSSMSKSDKLDYLIVDTTEEWYKAKHPKSSIDKVILINSLTVSFCPFCKSTSITKDGKREDGVQRYICKTCKKRFNPLTGTLFDSHKISISEWIEFLIHIFQFESMKVSSLDNRNAYSTGKYWTKKIFEVLKNYQEILGTFFLDQIDLYYLDIINYYIILQI